MRPHFAGSIIQNLSSALNKFVLDFDFSVRKAEGFKGDSIKTKFCTSLPLLHRCT